LVFRQRSGKIPIARFTIGTDADPNESPSHVVLAAELPNWHNGNCSLAGHEYRVATVFHGALDLAPPCVPIQRVIIAH
jgi:hypothetical protein